MHDVSCGGMTTDTPHVSKYFMVSDYTSKIIIESCFNVLGTLPMADEFLYRAGVYHHWKKMFMISIVNIMIACRIY